MVDCGVYTILNKINNKMYVGYSKNISYRLYIHKSRLNNNKHSNKHLQSAINKYGIENFEFEVLVECSEEFLASEEHYWATILNVHNREFGYNIDPTHPDGCKIHSKETRKLISEANKTRKPISQETRLKLSEKGKNRITTQETKDKISKANKGRVMSEEQKKLLSSIHKKRGTYKILEIAKLRRKPVLQYDLDGNFIREYSYAGEAELITNIHRDYIGKAAKSKYGKAKGYMWIYKESDIYPAKIEKYKIK